LSERGEVEAKTAGVTLIDNNFYPEICFTSYLKRSINTAAHITENFKNMNITYENVKKWELNERHYGALQGLDKIETAKKRSLSELGIGKKSGAKILAIKENEKLFTNPGGNFILQPGQVLIAFGSKEQLNILNGLLGNLVVAVELLK